MTKENIIYADIQIVDLGDSISCELPLSVMYDLKEVAVPRVLKEKEALDKILMNEYEEKISDLFSEGLRTDVTAYNATPYTVGENMITFFATSVFKYDDKVIVASGIDFLSLNKKKVMKGFETNRTKSEREALTDLVEEENGKGELNLSPTTVEELTALMENEYQRIAELLKGKNFNQITEMIEEDALSGKDTMTLKSRDVFSVKTKHIDFSLELKWDKTSQTVLEGIQLDGESVSSHTAYIFEGKLYNILDLFLEEIEVYNVTESQPGGRYTWARIGVSFKDTPERREVLKKSKGWDQVMTPEEFSKFLLEGSILLDGETYFLMDSDDGVNDFERFISSETNFELEGLY